MSSDRDDDTTGADGEEWGTVIPPNPQARAALIANESQAIVAELDLAQAMRTAFGNAGSGDARVQVFRRTVGVKNMEWLEDFDPEVMAADPMNTVREAFGGGRYELRLIGRTGIVGKWTLAIAGRPKKLADPDAAPPAPPAITPELSMTLRALADGQAALMKALAERPPAPPPMGIGDVLSIVKTLQSLTPTPPPVVVPSLSDKLREMRELRELATELSPDRDGEGKEPESLVGLAGSFLDVMKQAFAGRAPAEAPPMQPLQLPSSIASAAPPSDQPTPSPDMTQLLLQGITQGLIERAQAGTPHADAAAWLAEALPPEFDFMLKVPNWFELLQRYAPELAQHRAWVEGTKTELDKLLAADPG